MGVDEPRRILLIDPSRPCRYLYRELLKGYGIYLQCLDCYDEALELLSREHFHLIMGEIMVAGMTGYDFARVMRESPGKFPPFVAVSARAMKNEIARAYEAGIDMYVTKPVDIEAFTALILDKLDIDPGTGGFATP